MKYFCILKTARKNAGFSDFFDSYYEETKRYDEEFTLVIVDAHVWYSGDSRRDMVNRLVDDRFSYIHTEPKPSNWYGPYKKTRINFFDGASTVNTGLIVCDANKNDYIIFLDDCMVMCPGFLRWHIYAAENGYSASSNQMVVEGLKMSNNIPIEYKVLGSTVANHIDDRTTLTGNFPDGIKFRNDMYFCGGGGFAGNSSSTHFKNILDLNGFDEYFSRYNTEDMDMGRRLQFLSDSKGYKGIWRFPQAHILECRDVEMFEKGSPFHQESQIEAMGKQYKLIEGYEKDKPSTFSEYIMPIDHYPGIRSFTSEPEKPENILLNESITKSFQKVHDEQSYDENNHWKRLGHISQEWSKFNLLESIELYKKTGSFFEPNYLQECPFSGIPLGEL